MILTVTLNPAYDVTYRVDHVELGAVHRVSEVLERPGGKGVNVSRVLMQLGVPTVAMGFADAAFAESIGLPADFEIALPRVRRTVVVDADLPTRIAECALAAGVPVICDVDGEALRRAALIPGVVLEPNRDEQRRLGRPPDDLIGAGVRAVIATAGADGMTVTTADGTWSANVLPPPPLLFDLSQARSISPSALACCPPSKSTRRIRASGTHAGRSRSGPTRRTGRVQCDRARARGGDRRGC